ncbi:MAG: hypothetical protein ACK5AZ_05070 [Bryobacteraceae bacterium]
MKRLCLLLCLLASPAAAQDHAELAAIESVYFVKMTSGFDQYLANHFTQQGIFRVVTDPALADAIITDHLGENFEQRLKELYPEPEPEKPASKEDDEDDDEAKSPNEWWKNAPRISSWGRGKGNVFLVDRRNKRVVWSIYAKPKSSRADDLNKTARSVTSALRREFERQR